jgi:hypothetical protein
VPVYEEEPVVTRRVVEEPVVERRIVEEPIVQQRAVRQSSRSDDLTAYAVIKYGFILLMTLIILYFIVNFFLPLLR